MLMKSRTDSVEPKRAKPNTARFEPKREYDLIDRDDPNWVKSRTEMVEPTRTIPKIEKVDPNRDALR
jgi:hypothetical protein